MGLIELLRDELSMAFATCAAFRRESSKTLPPLVVPSSAVPCSCSGALHVRSVPCWILAAARVLAGTLGIAIWVIPQAAIIG